MNIERPKNRMDVSVVVTTWNGSAFIEQQLASLLQQTRLPDEIIVADDGSTDDTLERVRRFASCHDLRWTVLSATANAGLLPNVERGLLAATGDIVFLCDQDDVWQPGKVASFLEAFREDSVAAVFSDASLVDENLRPLGVSLWKVEGFSRDEREMVREGRLMEILMERNIVQGASLAFRRCWLSAIIPIPRDLHLRLWCHDGWIVAILSALGRIEPLEEKTLCYRVHGNNQIAGYSRLNTLRRWLPRSGRTLARSWMQSRNGSSMADIRLRDLEHQILHMRLVFARWGELEESGNDRGQIAGLMIWLEKALAHQKRRFSFPQDLKSRWPAVREERKAGGYESARGGWCRMFRDVFNF